MHTKTIYFSIKVWKLQYLLEVFPGGKQGSLPWGKGGFGVMFHLLDKLEFAPKLVFKNQRAALCYACVPSRLYRHPFGTDLNLTKII